MEYTALDILDAREERVELQEKLMDDFQNTLVCVRVNIPGVRKKTNLSQGIFEVISKEIEKLFQGRILKSQANTGAEGPIELLIIEEKSEKVKIQTIQLEETHTLGRFVDVDVYDHQSRESLSRTSMGFVPRKCYICDKPACECVRNQSHSKEEIICYIEKTYERYRSMTDE